MQIPKFENWMKFDRFYFHAKSKVKHLTYHKVKFHTSFKSCGHAEVECDTSLKRYNHAELISYVWKQT